MRLAVTGASGFVGRHVVRRALREGHTVRALTRGPRIGASLSGCEVVHYAGADGESDLRDAVRGSDAIIHLAALAHKAASTSAEGTVWDVNVRFARSMLLAAAAAGASRFVFTSTIGVHGEATRREAFDASSPIAPATLYARSKWEAEVELRALAATSSVALTVIRPPLVVGAGAPGNLLSLTRWVMRGTPLPIASIVNARSLIGANDLADCLIACATRSLPVDSALPVAGPERVSTPELARAVAAEAGIRATLFPFPPALLRLILTAAGRRSMAHGLTGDLVVDSSAAIREIDWNPRRTISWEIGNMVAAYEGRLPAREAT